MEIRYYQSGTRLPVKDYIEGLAAPDRAPVDAAIAAIAQHGLRNSGVDCRHIEGRLWEIRTKSQRIFYVVVLSGKLMVLLHAYKKQSQKMPRRELTVARTRMEEIINVTETS